MRRIFLSVIVALLALPPGALSQSSNQDSAIAELQRQLEEMRSQMAKMQNRITELEEAKGSAAVIKPSPESILPQSQIRSAQAVRPQRDEAKSPKRRLHFGTRASR
jgi:type II secretory pathway component PulM